MLFIIVDPAPSYCTMSDLDMVAIAAAVAGSILIGAGHLSAVQFWTLYYQPCALSQKYIYTSLLLFFFTQYSPIEAAFAVLLKRLVFGEIRAPRAHRLIIGGSCSGMHAPRLVWDEIRTAIRSLHSYGNPAPPPL